jgi:hypothetical protein
MNSHINKICTENLYKSPEIIALFIFFGLYMFLRIIETYIIPYIPSFFKKEISALFRWGPILVPIIFGVTYFSKKSYIEDSVLKERMMSWTKI